MLGENYPNSVVHIDIHNSGTFMNSETQARGAFYGVGGVPDVRIDGSSGIIGGGDGCIARYNAYLARYNQRMSATGGVSPVSIQGSWNISGLTATVNVTFTLLDPVNLGTVIGNVFLYEDDVYFNAQTSFDFLARSVKTDAITTLINPGDQVTLTKTIALNAGWDQSKLHVLASIQKNEGTNKLAYQGAEIPYLLDFSVTVPEKVASVPAGNGDAYFYGTITNDTSSPDVITLSFDNGFGAWVEAFQVEGDPNWYSDPTAFNFGGLEGKSVTIRVSTDATQTIRNGNFRAQSQNTGRLNSTGLRVFNGSYSVMFVDDDGTRTDEVPWITALDSMGLLYDTWSANANGNNGPNLSTVAGFDLVVWQHGYYLTGLLSSADTTNIKAYLDLGGALLLNSMDYMNLFNNANPPPTFVRDYLGVQTWQSGVTANTAVGVPGDPISDGMNMTLTYPSGGNRVDMINPVAGGSTFFLNHNSQSVAIRREFGRSSRVVFNTIVQNAFPTGDPDPNNSTAVIRQQILWLVNGFDPGSVGDLAPLAGRLEVSPNPSPGDARLRFSVSTRSAAHPVRLTVVDASGRKVRSLVDGSLPAGVHGLGWDGRDDAGRPAPSGVYFAKLTTIDGTDSQKLVLQR